MILLSPGIPAKQTEAGPYPCASQGCPGRSVTWIFSAEMAHQRQTGEQAGDRERHRSQHIQCRKADLAALVEQRGVERERGKRGVAAEDPGHDEQSPGLRRLALE